MKRLIVTSILSLVTLTLTFAQDVYERTGYDGDFFSLDGTIEVFKASRSLSDFERRINSQDAYVNNLDLDNDGRIDYIRVEHRRQGDVHVIILQDWINKYDVQDVAVIEIERLNSREAVLQIIGDRDLYGEELIVEPFEGSRTVRTGQYVSDAYVNVYYWPVVQQIFGRDYVVYTSPYRWNYYPTWWVSWHPFTWNIYINRIRPYRRYCRVVTYYRAPRVHRFYQPYRRYSRSIHERNQRVREYHGRNHPYANRPSEGTRPGRWRSDTHQAEPRREVNRNQLRPRQESPRQTNPNRNQMDRNRIESPERRQSPSVDRRNQPIDQSHQSTNRPRTSERVTPNPGRSGSEVRQPAARPSDRTNNYRKPEAPRTNNSVRSGASSTRSKTYNRPSNVPKKPTMRSPSSNVRKPSQGVRKNTSRSQARPQNQTTRSNRSGATKKSSSPRGSKHQ
ncbi:MAG: hypothetical protein KDC57_15355 [Saprospiraceae bacterium]|nr:hypothetical protein [Saprospiraceae bacterium]